MAMIPVVASGWISGVIRIVSVCRAPGSGCLTSTGTGFSGCAPSRKDGADSPLGLSISFFRSWRTLDARSKVLVPAVAPRKLSSLHPTWLGNVGGPLRAH